VDETKQQGNAAYVKFVAPLSMTLLKKSNVRTKPSIQANVYRVLGAGSQVTGVGHSGEWVKVKDPYQGLSSGWIHYALLGGRLK
jgi:SH3-like domain-containing protein